MRDLTRQEKVVRPTSIPSMSCLFFSCSRWFFNVNGDYLHSVATARRLNGFLGTLLIIRFFRIQSNSILIFLLRGLMVVTALNDGL